MEEVDSTESSSMPNSEHKESGSLTTSTGNSNNSNNSQTPPTLTNSNEQQQQQRQTESPVNFETVPEELTIFRLCAHGKDRALILRAKSTLEMHEWLNSMLRHKILAEQIINGLNE